jgi:hypothetical protein
MTILDLIKKSDDARANKQPILFIVIAACHLSKFALKYR